MPVHPGRILAAFALLLAAVSPALAQEEEPQHIEFGGGQFTIEETAELDKVLTYEGEELARNYFVFFDRIEDVRGTEIAFFSVGTGGNACAPAALMAWQTPDGDITTATLDEDCVTPSPAITQFQVFFVPYVLPGESSAVRTWNPEEGFRLHGRLSFAPEPDTDWGSFEPAEATYPLDLFRNKGIHDFAQALLGDDLTDVARGFGTSAEPEITAEGLLHARGCVPHACGVSDSFVVVDQQAKVAFFAQQDDSTRYWPERDQWPDEAAALIPDDF